MSENSKILGDCPERVALDLMKMILEEESKQPDLVKDRDYFLGLYADCIETVQGDLEDMDDDDDEFVEILDSEDDDEDDE